MRDCLVNVSVLKFQEWFEEKLAQTYKVQLDGIYSAIRPLLIFYSQLSENCNHFDTALKHSQDEHLFSLRKSIQNIQQLIQSFISTFPVCFDKKFTEQLSTSSLDCISQICNFLEPFSQKDKVSDEYDLHNIVIPRVKKIGNLITNHSKIITTLNQSLSSHIAILEFLEQRKKMFKDRLLEFDFLFEVVTEAQSRSEQFRTTTIRHSQLFKEYSTLINNEQLNEGRKLKKQIERCQFHLNNLTEPFFRACSQLKNKKRIVRDGLEIPPDDLQLLLKYCPIVQRSTLYEHIHFRFSLDDFMSFIDVFYKHIDFDTLQLSKKNRDSILEYQNTFDITQWIAIFKKWEELTIKLESLEDDQEYSNTLKRFEETKQEYESIVQKYDSLSRKVQDDINNYFRFINCFNNLRDDISKFCYQEFNICINITLEEDQSQENENREFIYN